MKKQFKVQDVHQQNFVLFLLIRSGKSSFICCVLSRILLFLTRREKEIETKELEMYLITDDNRAFESNFWDVSEESKAKFFTFFRSLIFNWQRV